MIAKTQFKYLLAGLLIVAFSINSMAQVRLGVRAGVNLAQETFDQDTLNISELLKNRSGVQIAAVTEFGIGSMFSIQPEILFSQKGWRIQDDSTGDFRSRITNYLELPILGKLSFGNEGFKFFVNAGPSFAYWMSAKERFKTDGDKSSVALELLKEEFNRFDILLNLGGGMSSKVGPGNVVIDFRYGVGFKDTNNTENKEVPDSYEPSKNRTIGVSLGYLIEL